MVTNGSKDDIKNNTPISWGWQGITWSKKIQTVEPAVVPASWNRAVGATEASWRAQLILTRGTSCVEYSFWWWGLMLNVAFLLILLTCLWICTKSCIFLPRKLGSPPLMNAADPVVPSCPAFLSSVTPLFQHFSIPLLGVGSKCWKQGPRSDVAVRCLRCHFWLLTCLEIL